MTKNETKEKLQQYFQKWILWLGLRWWRVEIIWHRKSGKKWRRSEGGTCAARTYADWRYGTIVIHVNLSACQNMDDDELKNLAVHELMHGLINEMREGKLHHEERVVTALTKAVFWVEDGAKSEARVGKSETV